MNQDSIMPLNTSIENRFQYNGKELEKDAGIGLSDYGARWYDASIGRFTSVDPLAEKYSFQSPYAYAVDNPISVIDPDGMDTLIMHRGRLNTGLSDKHTNVWDITFSLTRNGVSIPLSLPDGSPKAYMFGSKSADKKGDNYLNKDSYTLSFDRMPSHPELTPTIKVTSFGVFIHQGNDERAFNGCKGLCRTYKTADANYPRFYGEATQATIKQVESLYEKYESNLTGSKFLLKTNSTAAADSTVDWDSLIKSLIY